VCLFNAAGMFVKINFLLLIFKRLTFPISTANDKNVSFIENSKEMRRRQIVVVRTLGIQTQSLTLAMVTISVSNTRKKCKQFA